MAAEREATDRMPAGRLLSLLAAAAANVSSGQQAPRSPFGDELQLTAAAAAAAAEAALVAAAAVTNQHQEQSTWSLLLSALFYNTSDEFDVNWFNLILALILVMLMLTTAIGNLFVMVAILIERNLRTIGNYLVLSLAIADLLVACLVMPLAGIYLILERWTLGILLCDIWTSADVFCCTASILHLLAIALDRYWAVTRVDYIRCQRNERRILFMIFFVWMAACVISLAPVFGWKDAQFEERITNDHECLISQDIGYQIFATCTTFYFPLTLTLIFYWKIYQVARKRIRRKPGNRVRISLQHPSSSSSSSSPGLKLAAPQQQAHCQSGRHRQSSKRRSIGDWRRQRLCDLCPSWLGGTTGSGICGPQLLLAASSSQRREGQRSGSQKAHATSLVSIECSPTQPKQKESDNRSNGGGSETHSSKENPLSSMSGRISSPSSPPTAQLANEQAEVVRRCQCLCHLPREQEKQQHQQRPACTAGPGGTLSAVNSASTAVDFDGAFKAPAGGAQSEEEQKQEEEEQERAMALATTNGLAKTSAADAIGVAAIATSSTLAAMETTKMATTNASLEAPPKAQEFQAELLEQKQQPSQADEDRGEGEGKSKLNDYHHEIGFEESNADNQIFDTQGSTVRRAREIENSSTAPTPQAEAAPLANKSGDDGDNNYNMGPEQSSATIQTKDKQQRNLAASEWLQGGAEFAPAEEASARPVEELASATTAAACVAGCDNDRPLQMEFAADSVSASTIRDNNASLRTAAMAPSSANNNNEGNSISNDCVLGHGDENEDDEGANFNSNANVAAAAADTTTAKQTWASSRTGNCSNCRRCHWARLARGRAASGQIDCSELNCKQASSFSSEIQSSIASYSQSSSLANCDVDFNLSESNNNNSANIGATAASEKQPIGLVKGELTSGQQQGQNLPGNCSPRRYSSTVSAGPTGTNGSGECTDMLDECCGCCCTDSHPGTAFALATNCDIEASDRISERSGSDVGASNRRRQRLRPNGSSSEQSLRLLTCSLTAPTNKGYHQAKVNKEQQQQHCSSASSRVSLNGRGFPVSELAAPPTVGHYSPNECEITRAAAAGATTASGGGSYDQQQQQQQQRRQSRVVRVIRLIHAASVALCWRRLVAQLNRQARQTFVPTESSAACEVGLLRAAAQNVNNLNTVLVDENGQSSLIRGDGNAISVCKICKCVIGAESQVTTPAEAQVRPPTLTRGQIPAKEATLEQQQPSSKKAAQPDGPRTKAAGMVIAASTANIAVTTVRPPFVSANSVQYQAAMAAAAATEGLESKRERKAAKTLAIITGVFVMCWLPFFVMAITMPLLDLRPHKYVFALMLWLGYFNSMLNPIIYTIFSPDFRKAFKRLLCGLDTEAERRRLGRQRLNRSSFITTTVNNNNTSDTLDQPCSPSMGQSNRPLVRHIHPLLARCCGCCCCCLPSSVARAVSTRTMTSKTSVNSKISEISERKKTEQAACEHVASGSLNNNYLQSQSHPIGFSGSPNKRSQQQAANSIHSAQRGFELERSQVSAATASNSPQQPIAQHGTINTTGRPFSTITNDF